MHELHPTFKIIAHITQTFNRSLGQLWVDQVDLKKRKYGYRILFTIAETQHIITWFVQYASFNTKEQFLGTWAKSCQYAFSDAL